MTRMPMQQAVNTLPSAIHRAPPPIFEQALKYKDSPVSTSGKLLHKILKVIAHDKPDVVSFSHSSGLLEAQLLIFAADKGRSLNIWRWDVNPDFSNQYLKRELIIGGNPEQKDANVAKNAVKNARALMIIGDGEWSEIQKMLHEVDRDAGTLRTIIWIGSPDEWTAVGAKLTHWLKIGTGWEDYERIVRSDTGSGLGDNEIAVTFTKVIHDEGGYNSEPEVYCKRRNRRSLANPVDWQGEY